MYFVRSIKQFLTRLIHTPLLLQCVCVAIPFILDVRLVDVPAGVTQEEVTQDSTSFCGTCLDFYRQRDSAAPFPRRPQCRILCAH